MFRKSHEVLRIFLMKFYRADSVICGKEMFCRRIIPRSARYASGKPASGHLVETMEPNLKPGMFWAVQDAVAAGRQSLLPMKLRVEIFNVGKAGALRDLFQ